METGKNYKKRITFKTLHSKILTALLAISLIPIIIVGTLSVNNISFFSLREMERASIANLSSASKALIDQMKELKVEAIRPSDYNTNVTVEVLRQEVEKGEADIKLQFEMKVLLAAVNNNSRIHSLYVFGNSGSVYTNRSIPTLAREDLQAQKWFADWLKSGTVYCWGDPYELGRSTVVPYAHKIMDKYDCLGICVVNIYESALYDSYQTYGNILALNSKNIIFSAADKSIIGKSFFDVCGISDPIEYSGSDCFQITVNDINYTAVYYENDTYDICLIELLSTESSRTVLTDMFNSTLIIVLSCGAVCILLALYLSGKITKPLHKIRDKVDTFELESLESNMQAQSNDEIGMLINSINNMTLRLNASKEEILRISEERRKAEYKAIELQINPHFLYNTLSAISALSDAGETDKVNRVIEALSSLFRISVNKGKEQIRIQDEIQHVRCYLEILSIRHAGEFTYQLDIDPDILDCYTIKIILQPLVENAIQHGILENAVRDGFIRIIGYQKEDKVILEVLDNGNIPERRIQALNDILRNPEGYVEHGVGMLNVQNRISHFYNHDFGLIYSKRGIMTVAHIEIPVIKGENDVQLFSGGR